MVGVVAFMALGIWISGWEQNRLQKIIQQWPTTEATIEGGTYETVPRASRHDPMKAPVLSFSYHVGGEYYSGRIMLMQFFNDEGAAVIRRMILKKLEIRYDPKDSTRWFYNDNTLAGCVIRQEGMKPEDGRTF